MNPILPEACLLVTEAGGSLERAGCSLQELLKGCFDEPFGYLKFLCALYFYVALLEAFSIKAEAFQRPIITSLSLPWADWILLRAGCRSPKHARVPGS